ncbi:insulinase family protein [Pedobacter hiemivivus]|uniref:Insulinase family protein n=1 Tax=Pedobacter hiemivivus TaxID=2530454 RepID=A0A4R0NCE7_9SPHI|nr:M16 family metallopeptidase [Pedobacter hiemivivus]TCC97905.1 insulinase family protein [Pedobacter hiemivivus]TKC60094.1 insulinase family protein [Pedobacter hiemivivus]
MRNKINFIVLTLAALGILNSNIYAQQLQQDPNLVKGKLKNGFTYYIYKSDKTKGNSVLRLFLNAGSLQEEPDQLGLAHFIEHMAFNGTKHYSKNDVIEFLESKGVKFGADLNAHTSFDETVYKISINTKDEKNLEKSIDIMADWAFGVTFDSHEIDKERGVVIEEWRSKQGAANRLREQYLPVLFNKSRYAERLPIGKVDILKSFKRQTIVDFYEKWYRPDLMSIAIVTDIDPKKVEEYIKTEFNQYKAKSKSPRLYYELPAHRDTLFSILTDKEANAIELSVFNKIKSFNSIKTEQDYKDQLIRTFFNALAKSRFSRVSQLQNDFKEGSFSVSNIVLKNGIVSGGASLYHDKVKEGIAQYLTEAQRICRYGLTNDEVNKYRDEYIAAIKRSVAAEDKTAGETYMNEIHDVFYNGSTMLAKEERNRLALKYAPQIDSLTLLNFLRSVNKAGNTVVLLTAPEKDKANLPSQTALKAMFAKAATEQVASWTDQITVPAKLLAQEPVTGKVVKEELLSAIGVTKWTLANGTIVYLKPTAERKNYISLSGFRKGGIYALDSSQYVTAQFVKPVTGLSGAGDFSRRALTQFLTGNSASATLVLSSSREGVVSSADWKDAKTMFQLIYLKWMYPNADPITFEQAKRQSLEQLENNKLSPNYTYTKAISELLKGDDDYASEMSAERLSKEAHLKNVIPIFKSRFGSAKDFQFVIVGGFNLDSIKPLIEQYIGGLPAGDYNNKFEYKGPVGGSSAKDILIYAGAAPKSTVNLFHQSNKVNYDYPDILVQTMLQEVLKVKLRLNLREKNSGVYGVGVSISSTSVPNPLIRARISFSCAPESTDFLIKQAQIEVKKVADNPAYFASDLTNIKVQQIDGYKKQADKNLFWSSALRNQFYFGFKDYSYFNDFENMINKITPAMVADYAKKYLIDTPGIKAVLLPENFKTLN